jgi:ubiquinone/menaquinone biosynthesis C-methylase UbiE
MEKPIYDTIGENYNENRAADPHILRNIVELLDLQQGSLIADIGAGTGNYSNALADLGYRVTAIEPSKVMCNQAKPHKKVSWLESTAESIPLKDNSVNGIIAILCIHHFSNLVNAAKEFHRICPGGPVVVLTYDPRKGNKFWFNEYFPEIYKQEFEYFPAIDEVADILADREWKTIVRDFPLPHDLADKNMHSGWNRPEIYFSEQMRLNTSGFARAQKSEVEKGLSRLKQDLNSGFWDAKYGYLRQQTELKTGFMFIKLWAEK